MNLDFRLAKKIIELIKKAEKEVRDMHVIDLEDEDRLLLISNHKEDGAVIRLIPRSESIEK